MPYSDPKYPIINASPSVDDSLRSMRFSDVATAVGITSASWGFGYIVGKPARMPTASTASAIGMTFAGLLILQDTRGRLMGYCENSREVRLYGALKDELQPNAIATNRRFPQSHGMLSAAIKPKPDIKNYD